MTRQVKTGKTSLALVLTVAGALLLVVMLVRGHTTGGEIRGVMAAGMSVVAGALAYRSAGVHRGRVSVAASSLLWITVVVLGVAGTLDHDKAVRLTSADQRARPAVVPLVFSAMGLGGVALVAAGRRPGAGPGRRLSEVMP